MKSLLFATMFCIFAVVESSRKNSFNTIRSSKCSKDVAKLKKRLEDGRIDYATFVSCMEPIMKDKTLTRIVFDVCTKKKEIAESSTLETSVDKENVKIEIAAIDWKLMHPSQMEFSRGSDSERTMIDLLVGGEDGRVLTPYEFLRLCPMDRDMPTDTHFPKRMSEKMRDELSRRPSVFALAKDVRGKLRGMIAGCVLGPVKEINLEYFFVDGNFQNCGIEKKMLEALLIAMKRAKMAYIEVTGVKRENKKAFDLFKTTLNFELLEYGTKHWRYKYRVIRKKYDLFEALSIAFSIFLIIVGGMNKTE